jgi:hypothetical protein
MKLRAEIRTTRARVGSDLAMVDLDGMLYSLAVVKACLCDNGWRVITNTIDLLK